MAFWEWLSSPAGLTSLIAVIGVLGTLVEVLVNVVTQSPARDLYRHAAVMVTYDQPDSQPIEPR